MSDNTIRDAAIEAAARLAYFDSEASLGSPGWDSEPEAFKANECERIAPLVDAVLAVALPEWRKHAFELRKTAIREARAEALRDAADDFAVIPHPYEGGVTSWLRDRADAEEAS